MVDFGRIGDALAAGQRAEARQNLGPIVSAPAEFASLNFGTSDFATASYFNALNRDTEFLWGIDKWGAETYKVSE